MKKTRETKHHTGLKTITAVVLLCAAITADSAFRLTVSRYDEYSSRLPESFDGFKIVQLSDLHGAQFDENNSRLVEKVAALEPDIIALTGDYFDDQSDLNVMENLCRQLVGIAPVYFISGNHDWASGLVDEAAEMMEKVGVRYLRNEYETITHGDEEIIIAGVEDPNSWAVMTKPDELVNEIREEHPEDFTILLGHRNDWPEKYPRLDVDIILSGHGHGGIIRLPFVGGVIGTNRQLFPQYDAGEFRSGNYTMIVSRGLGGAVIPRFLNNPDIVLITLNTTK